MKFLLGFVVWIDLRKMFDWKVELERKWKCLEEIKKVWEEKKKVWIMKGEII